MSKENKPGYYFWFQQNIDRVRSETAVLNYEQKGIHSELCMVYWQVKCNLELGDAATALHISKAKLQSIIDKINGVEVVDGGVVIDRLKADMEKAKAISEKRRDAVVKGRWLKPVAPVQEVTSDE